MFARQALHAGRIIGSRTAGIKASVSLLSTKLGIYLNFPHDLLGTIRIHLFRPSSKHFTVFLRVTVLIESVQKGPLSSRTAAVAATAASVGSIAWYTHLYGQLPFIGEMSANSPAETGLHAAQYPWSHKGWLDSFDHARRAHLFIACCPTPYLYDPQHSPRISSVP